MSEIKLRDAILRNALQLQRLAAGLQGQVEKILRRLERDLKQLIHSEPLSEGGKATVNSLIKEADDLIKPAYAEVATTVDTGAIAISVSKNTIAALDTNLASAALAPSDTRLASLTKDVMIDGAPSSAWWARQADDTAFKFAAAVRQGVINGETNESIVSRVVTARGEVGLMETSRRNARTLVHSAVMSVANDARLATFRKNSRLIAGVRWLATLDSHTCLVCAALDGQAWDLDGNKLKGTTMSFQAPPKHWSCRCVLSPIPKTFAELGIDMAEPNDGERASAFGPVPAKTNFTDFLKRQSPAFVDEVLGKRRAELFLAGKLTLTDLVSGTGRELTLAELHLI